MAAFGVTSDRGIDKMDSTARFLRIIKAAAVCFVTGLVTGCVPVTPSACTSPASLVQIESAETTIKAYLKANGLKNFLLSFTQFSKLVYSEACGSIIVLQYEPWTPPDSLEEVIGGISEYRVNVTTREVSWKALSD